MRGLLVLALLQAAALQPPPHNPQTSLQTNTVAAGDLVISQFRWRGPGGSTDEYVEITNKTASQIITPFGLSIAAETSGLLAQIPAGTIIRPYGQYLAANRAGFSLQNTPETGYADPDSSWAVDVGDAEGVGIFSSAVTFSAGTKIDSVGFTGSVAPWFEGAGLSPAAGISENAQWAWFRRFSGSVILDNGVNNTDVRLQSIDGAVLSGLQSLLGPPNPRNRWIRNLPGLTVTVADQALGGGAQPNRLNVVGGGLAGSNLFYFRWKFTNNSSQPISSVRIRMVRLNTYPTGTPTSDGGTGEWHATESSDVEIPITGQGNVTAYGWRPEAPTTPYAGTNGTGGGAFCLMSIRLPQAVPIGGVFYTNYLFSGFTGTFTFQGIVEVK